MWEAVSTGNMTLSVLDEERFQILKVDMLQYDTIRAGTDGERLAQAYNDLSIIALFSENIYSVTKSELPFPDGTISPMPWAIEYDNSKKKIVIRNAQNKKICEKKYPSSLSETKFNQIVDILERGIQKLTIVPEDKGNNV